jgi:MFS family permease
LQGAPPVASTVEGGSAVTTGLVDTRTPLQQWYLVIVLTLTYIVGHIDRGAINLVADPIRHDLGLTDVQMSLLLGFAFVTLYSIGIIPMGYLVDRISRRLLVSGAVIFWSGSAVVSGFAGSYWQLFAARASLGLGESALPPTAYSLLRDGVSEKNRGRAFATYQSGITLGSGLGALIGGAIFGLAVQGVLAPIPLFGHLKPWQLVVVIPGVFGLFAALLLMTIREPPRAKAPVQGEQVTFAELFKYMRANAGIYTVIFVAVVTVSLGTAGWNAWIAAALGRSWGLSPAEIGTMVGTLGLILFPIAAFTVGTLMDFIKRRWNTPSAPWWVAIGGCILNLAPAMAVLHAPTLTWMWIFYGCFIFCTTSGVQAACGYMLATVTPGRLMGKATSCYYLNANLLAGATAPTIVALISQLGFEGPRGLANAMTISYATFVSITVGVLLIGVRQTRAWYDKNRSRGTS